jgi:acyl-CoA oxidase
VLARYAVTQAAGRTLHRSGLRRVAQTVADSGSEKKSAIALRDEGTQHELLSDRVQARVAELAAVLRGAKGMSQEKAAALFNEHQDQLIEVAHAHAELLQWEAFTRGLKKLEDPGTREVLTRLRDLFGLCLIEKDLAWFLMNGRLSSQRARTLDGYINRLLVKIRPHAMDLVEAFGYGPEHLRSAVAGGAEQERQEEAAEYLRRRRASGDAPIDEKTLLAREAKEKKARKAKKAAKVRTQG